MGKSWKFALDQTHYPSLPENSCPPIVKNLIYGHSWRQLFPTISTVLNGAIPSSVNLNTNFRQLPINIILCQCCTSFRVGAIFPDIIVQSSRYLNCEPFDLCSITLSNRCWDRCWDYSTWLSNKWIFSRGKQFFQFWIFQLRLVRLLEVLEERKDWKIVKVIASILYLLFQANTHINIPVQVIVRVDSLCTYRSLNLKPRFRIITRIHSRRYPVHSRVLHTSCNYFCVTMLAAWVSWK